MTTFGQRGGEGPTRGKLATTYRVTLPDGVVMLKRTFSRPVNPAGYAYQYVGTWYVAAIAEADSVLYANYTHCPAVPEEPK